MLFISHDTDVVNRLCDRIGILYAGRIVEQGSVRQVMDNPLHPYTNGLMASIPGVLAGDRLFAMPGSVPGIGDVLPGCAFAPRCPHAMPQCLERFPDVSLQPDLNDPEIEHTVYCHLFLREIRE
jgi:oligopeptide/dipeptide ABC transporter ATP-binding protein